MMTDYFGDAETALAFMRAFAGTLIRVPSTHAVERLAKERQIVRALERDPATSTVRRLSSLQGTHMRHVAKTFAKRSGTGLKNLRASRAAAGASSIEGSSNLACRTASRSSSG